VALPSNRGPGKGPTYTVGPSGCDFPDLSTANRVLAAGAVIFVDPAYAAATDRIVNGNQTIIFGSLRGAAKVGTLAFDSSSSKIHSVIVVGGEFETVTFSPSNGNNISDVRFVGSQVSTSARAGGIHYTNGEGTSYVQQIDWFGCRFDDLGGASGVLHNISGSPNPSAGGYNTHGCKYVAGGNASQQCFFHLPMGQQMVTDCTHEDLMFTNNNTAGTTYALLVGGTAAGAGVTRLASMKFSHCYFELHGKTVGAYVGPNATPNAVHLYVLFEEGTYNIAPTGSWQIWSVNNANWKPRAANGLSGVAMHFGHRMGPNAPTPRADGIPTTDYVAEYVDPNGFVG
jgi:hypothetical protein